MLKSLFSKELKVIITFDEIRLKPKLPTNKTNRFTKNSFFNTILGFTQPPSRPSGDVDGLIQLLPGSYKS